MLSEQQYSGSASGPPGCFDLLWDRNDYRELFLESARPVQEGSSRMSQRYNVMSCIGSVGTK